MYTKSAFIKARSVLGAAIAACTLFAGDVGASGRPVTVTLKVSTQGIDLNEPAGARELYHRLKVAARIACTSANRVGLEPSPDPEACYEKALGKAIASVHIPQLALAYLETHTLGQATAYGINVPVAAAAK